MLIDMLLRAAGVAALILVVYAILWASERKLAWNAIAKPLMYPGCQIVNRGDVTRGIAPVFRSRGGDIEWSAVNPKSAGASYE
jgi:hypothetical protein